MSLLRIVFVCLLAPFVISACEPGNQTTQSQEPGQPTEAATPTETTTAAGCELTLGWDPWEPYHYRDVGGEVRGLDIELVAAIAREAGCKLRFDQEDWGTLLQRVRSGDVDMLSGATRTADRESFAWFTAPYRTESFRLYIREGESEKFEGSTLQELLEAAMKIGTTLDYVYGDEVNRLQDDDRFAAQFQGVAVGEVNYDKLLNFNIDGLLEDSFVAASVIRKKGLDNQIDEHPLVVSTGDVHLMLSKASVDEETVDRLNAALARVKSSGTFDRIIERYLN
ncbi:MAG: transporter substrate-binding domain-containing protein [Gammaproteobacteria bacterium]|nr:transporter substrate-binding domain-containing protein [Gammaproteobacteria bacterium]NND58989.1 amino acid ABC transporter substrate-binding protein [Gammaproteobacteria bacterium]